MKLAIKSVTVTINERDALSIINVLQKGMPFVPLEDTREEVKPANTLLSLLSGAFQSSKKGVHY